MTRAELESKHLAELHSLAAEAGVPGYRMLPRNELIDALAAGDAAPAETPRRQMPARAAARPPTPEPRAEAPEPRSAPPAPRRRRRRRRPFGRRGGKQVRVHELVLPPAPGRQVIVYADSREACTSLLRELAAELASASKGPDPVAILIDPSPDEVADWVREAAGAEIVAAGQPRHADDALAQAAERAKGGEDVILLVDSLTRLAVAHGDAEAAKDFFDAGRSSAGPGSGSLTVVAAVERRAVD